MSIRRIQFRKISVKATRRWKDPETGKPRQETREFWQTENPFNCGEDGAPKTREQIYAEINSQARHWLEKGAQ